MSVLVGLIHASTLKLEPGRDQKPPTYPEVPFTLVQHLCLGLTGLAPQRDGGVTTSSHLQQGWVEVTGVPFRTSHLAVRHEGRAASTLTVIDGDHPVRWTAHVGDGVVHRTVRPGESVRVTA